MKFIQTKNEGYVATAQITRLYVTAHSGIEWHVCACVTTHVGSAVIESFPSEKEAIDYLHSLLCELEDNPRWVPRQEVAEKMSLNPDDLLRI